MRVRFLKALLAIADLRRTAQYPFFLDRGKPICYSAGKIGFDTLRKLPRSNTATQRLIELLGARDVFRIS